MKGIVWGLDRPTCGGKLDTLITEYELMWNIKPSKIKKSQMEYEVIFENGDIWRAVVATESSRGRKCNISLVDSRIPYEYMPIIECSTTCPPFHAISYY
jgi:hypothetical protein